MKIEKIVINDTEYNSGKVLVIAELGTSHGADPVKAAELIEAAAEAGADCIKFQIVYASEILHPNTGEVQLPGGKIRLFQRFKELETEPEFFAKMKEKVEKKGLIFLCTPFGLKSARILKELNPKCVKIASPELNFTALLKEIASYKLPVFLSTGVSKLGDIEKALSYFPKNLPGGETGICLLHCVTAYPAAPEDYKLRLLPNLSAIFGVPVGISDHSLDPCLIPALGTAMGAPVIEKHFCLSRNDPGLDDPIALPPEDFARMVKAIRRAEKDKPETTIENLSLQYGSELVEAILGDGVKHLAPSELNNYERSNRSLHAVRDIAKGEIINADMVSSLRTEKNLRPGLPPDWEERIIGRKAAASIPAGEGIRFEDI